MTMKEMKVNILPAENETSKIKTGELGTQKPRKLPKEDWYVRRFGAKWEEVETAKNWKIRLPNCRLKGEPWEMAFRQVRQHRGG